MRLMKKSALLLLALLASAFAARPRRSTPDDPYEFILAKLAAEDGRFDEALSRIDKIIAKNPQNPVLLYERAHDPHRRLEGRRRRSRAAQGRRRAARTSTTPSASSAACSSTAPATTGPRSTKRSSICRPRSRINPDDLATGMAISQIYLAPAAARPRPRRCWPRCWSALPISARSTTATRRC